MKTLKRRRKENKTDYLKRIKLLKSNRPRVVFRKTNKYFISQYITSKEAQDRIEIGLNSRQLLNYGWPKSREGSLKSIPASYLLGILTGKKIKEKKLKTPIVDFGIMRVLHRSRPSAFVKGLLDSGLDIKTQEKIFPNEERITGKHMKDIPFSEIKSKILGKNEG